MIIARVFVNCTAFLGLSGPLETIVGSWQSHTVPYDATEAHNLSAIYFVEWGFYRDSRGDEGDDGTYGKTKTMASVSPCFP